MTRKSGDDGSNGKRPVFTRLFAGLTALTLAFAVPATAQTVKPIKVLMVSGGGYHNYANQRQILEAGLKARINAEITHVFYELKPGEDITKPALPIFSSPNYADDYDVVVHNECAAGIDDPSILSTVLAPHIKGVPGVNIHCGMHSYRSGDWRKAVAEGAANGLWFEYLGIQSSGHGPQFPIALTKVNPDNPVIKGVEMWTTPREELYNNLRTFGDITPLVTGQQPGNPDPKGQADKFIVTWTHLYGPAKTRVFSTTLAHNDVSMTDPRYLDMVANGVLWATSRLGADGKPAPGYAAAK